MFQEKKECLDTEQLDAPAADYRGPRYLTAISPLNKIYLGRSFLPKFLHGSIVGIPNLVVLTNAFKLVKVHGTI